MGEKYSYRGCFLAYLDILGFKEKIEESQDNSKTLETLIDALKINTPFTQSEGKKTTSEGKLDIRSFFFSDSFVFIMKKEKRTLPHLFFIIRYLQDRLWESGLCLRGAIVKGEMYWPTQKENIILDPAMIEAYNLESHIAIYPRVVVSEKLCEYIEQNNVNTWSEGPDRPLKEFIKKDRDGVYFFDLLNRKMTRKKGERIESNKSSFSIVYAPLEEKNYDEVIESVKKIIKEEKMQNEDVKQKCEWLRSYLEDAKREGR